MYSWHFKTVLHATTLRPLLSNIAVQQWTWANGDPPGRRPLESWFFVGVVLVRWQRLHLFCEESEFSYKIVVNWETDSNCICNYYYDVEAERCICWRATERKPYETQWLLNVILKKRNLNTQSVVSGMGIRKICIWSTRTIGSSYRVLNHTQACNLMTGDWFKCNAISEFFCYKTVWIKCAFLHTLWFKST